MLILLYRIFYLDIPNEEMERFVVSSGPSQAASGPIPQTKQKLIQRKIRKKADISNRSSSSKLCVGLKPALKSMELFDLDLKKDEVYFSTLMKLFDGVEENILLYMKKLGQGLKEDGVLCAPLREEISNIEYMLSLRDGRDPQVRNLILIKYTSIAYKLLDQRISYFPLTQVAGLFMNITQMHFFTKEQEKELTYIYNRIHDDYKAFKHTSNKRDGLDKNREADVILLLDWISSLDN